MNVYVVVGQGDGMLAVEVFTDEADAEIYLDMLIEAGLQSSYYRMRTIDNMVTQLKLREGE